MSTKAPTPVRLCLAISLFAMTVPISFAKPRISDWTFSPVVGVMQPSLDSINSGIFQSPYRGVATLTTDFRQDLAGRFAYSQDSFLLRNPLPPVQMGPETGIELRRSFNPKTDFVTGLSFWEISSRAKIDVKFPMQGVANNDASYDRRANLRITQYYLGARRYFGERTRRLNFYLDMNYRQLFDIKYQDESVFSFTSGPPKGYKRIHIVTARTTGISMLHLGAGSEIRILDRMTVALEGGYFLLVGDKPFLRNVKEISDYNDGDLLSFREAPFVKGSGSDNDSYYKTPDGSGYKEARLDLNGWRVLVKANVEF